MSDNSLIEWCSATWNFLIGCTKKSAGCMHCYAIRQAWRMMHNPNPKIAKKFEGTVHKDSKGELNWTGRVNFDEDLITKPLSWRLPRRVFVNSLSDLFHKNVKDEWIDQAFAVMALCPHHTFQILTKEPQRMRDYLARRDRHNQIELAADRLLPGKGHQSFGGKHKLPALPLRNVHLGTSVENQETADERIPLLLQTPAAVTWISAEPLLGPIDLGAAVGRKHGAEYHDKNGPCTCERDKRLDWIVVGGESGPKARPMHPDWARSLREQCRAAGVSFFFKQWGAWAPFQGRVVDAGGGFLPSGEFIENPALVDGFPRTYNTPTSVFWMRRVGKKAAGRLLDGREWSEYPESKGIRSSMKAPQSGHCKRCNADGLGCHCGRKPCRAARKKARDKK